MELPTMLPTANPDVIFQDLDDGAVLFDPTKEVYFGLNRAGARIWQLLPPARTSLDEVVAALAAEYPEVSEAVLREDAAELLRDLTAQGLVKQPVPAAPA
jgi:hypothetical protein